MAAEVSLRSKPLWIRAAHSPLITRVVVVATLCAAYVALFLLAGDHSVRFALRPINLVLVVIAGGLFGMWG